LKKNVVGEEKKHLWAWDILYQNKKKYVRLFFDTLESMKAYEKVLLKQERHLKYIDVKKRYYRHPVYETNIDPMLRAMHIRNISASGWVEFKKYTELDLGEDSTANINIQSKWTNLIRHEKSTKTKLKICA